MIDDPVAMVWWLLIAHLAGDYWLQSDTIAVNKNPWASTELQKQVPWYYWMTAHAAMHGGAVTLVLGSVWLGIAETAVHFLIDLGKCRGWYAIHGDQLLHLAARPCGWGWCGCDFARKRAVDWPGTCSHDRRARALAAGAST